MRAAGAWVTLPKASCSSRVMAVEQVAETTPVRAGVVTTSALGAPPVMVKFWCAVPKGAAALSCGVPTIVPEP